MIVKTEHPGATEGLVLDYGADGSDAWDRFARVTDLTRTPIRNDANELETIAETHGSAWIDSAHDAAGNMTLAARSIGLTVEQVVS